jgi:hypothetical protein
MSILKLKHTEIDSEKWNYLLSQSASNLFYVRYEYITAVHPNWKALIQIEDGEYKIAFPLTEKSKHGLTYLVQPNLIQYFPKISVQNWNADDFNKKLVKIFSRYPSMRVSIDYLYSNQLRKIKNIPVTERRTTILQLKNGRDYRDNYSSNHLRNIKKFEKQNYDIVVNRDYEELLQGFVNYNKNKFYIGTRFVECFERLIPFFEEQENFKVLSAFDGKERIASALFATYNKRCVFLLSYSNEPAKRKGVMHGLVDYWLYNCSENLDELDFEGGNIPTLARFYISFGAMPKHFNFLQKHKFPINLVLKKTEY